MSEPVYDEDMVNLGYLKRIISNTEDEVNKKYENVSRHYASKPQPPYNKGDTWIDGNAVYTCINSRQVGNYVASDWITESGATEKAENKNKTYLTKPSNYNPGDMWILQSDNDHKAGKKGEILISTAGRKDYDEDDWINMLGYGSIRSINEVADNLNGAINRIGNVEEAIEDGIIVTFYQDSVPEGKHLGDLWYVTGEAEGYTKGKIYRYDGAVWILLDDPEIQKAFDEANEARLVADGKIQSFYSDTEPTKDMGVGDLWIDIANNNQLYRYNGTKWVAVYDTRINDLVVNVDTVTERVTTIETDLGKIDLKVEETTTKVTTIEENAIKTVQVQYALSDSTTEAPTSGWSTTAPTWESGKYMWQRTVTTYSDDTTKTSEPTCIQGAKGENGADGKDGANGKNGTNGKDGEKGDTGIGVSLLETEYYLSTSDTEQAGGEWSTTEPKYEADKYYWTRTKITWTDNSVTYTDPILAEGINNANQSVDDIKATEATASGKNIHIEDSSEEPLADIVVKGETKQETSTRGINYCPDINEWTLSNGAYIENGYIVLPSANARATSPYIPIDKQQYFWRLYAKAYTETEGNKILCDTYYYDNTKKIVSGNGNEQIIGTVSTDNDYRWAFGGDSNTTYGQALYNAKYIRVRFSYNTNHTTGLYKIKMPMITSEYQDEFIVYTPNKPSPDYPSEIENVEGKNLIDQKTIFANADFELNDDGYYVGQPNNLYLLYDTSKGGILENLKENTQYTLSYTAYKTTDTNNGIRSTFVGVVYTDGTTTGIMDIYASTPTKYTYTTVANKTVKQIYLSYGYNKTTAIKNFQIEEGTIATEYVPYNSLEFKVVGKNIIPFPYYNKTTTAQGVTFTQNDDGSVTANGTATADSAYNFLTNGNIVLKEGKYTLSGLTGGSSVTYYLQLYVNNKSQAALTSGSRTYSFQEGDILNRLVLFFKKGAVFNNLVIKPQLEYNEEATDYEPYKSQTETFPLAEGQKLYESSYLADDGIHHTRKQYVITGEENWALGTQYTPEYGTRFDCNITTYPKAGRTNAVVCSHYKYKGANKGACWVDYEGGGNYLQLRIQDNFETVDELKTYLQEQYTNGTPVIVEYELAEEEIIPYTEEQQEAWNKIKELYTYKNITNITSTADLDIVYVRDNGLSDMYETKQNANKRYEETTEKFAQTQITLDSIKDTVSSTTTTAANNYAELTNKFNDYAPKSDVVTIQKSVEKIQTDTYTKTEINTKLTDGSVTKVSTTAGTFDDNGLTIEKTDAKTKGNFNEKGITVMDATSSSAEELLFAGYDEELSETIVRTKNINVEKYLTKCNIAREEAYTNLTLGGKGIGVFIL